MIAQISGKLVKNQGNSILIDISGISYEVLVPTAIVDRIEEAISADGCIKLITYHYYNMEPSRSVPVLIGFLNEIEKDFFQKFITVSGIGPRAAIRALSQPISRIAKAIDESDAEFLRSLPGIGQQRAKEIIAKLQGKVGKYALIKDSEIKEAPKEDAESEAIEILSQLQYTKNEAKEMISKARLRAPDITTTEGLLNEVYRQRARK